MPSSVSVVFVAVSFYFQLATKKWHMSAAQFVIKWNPTQKQQQKFMKTHAGEMGKCVQAAATTTAAVVAALHMVCGTYESPA